MLSACDNDDTNELSQNGNLSLFIKLDIEEIPLNGRALTEIDINTDDFIVTIFEEDGTEFMVFDPFSNAPENVSLPTGTYYVEASSNNAVNAAFDAPFYFGKTDVFSIDKEEEKKVTIDMSLANTQVSIVWSDNVIEDFSSYSAKLTLVDTADSLVFTEAETRSGYFITAPLGIEITLEYIKLDGSTISQNFSKEINEPKPKTHYRITVDASLQDGKMTFNFNIDQEVEVIDLLISNDTWENNFGGEGIDKGYAIYPTDDGGMVVVGSTASLEVSGEAINYGYSNYKAIKLDKYGAVTWEKSFGGSGFEIANSVIEKETGGYAICGQSGSSDGDISGSNGGRDIWIINLDTDGEILWENSYGSSLNEFGLQVRETTDNGLLVGGYVDNGTGVFDITIYSLNQNGDVIWNKILGGTANDNFTALGELSDGNYMVVGESSSTDRDNNSNKGQSDIWMIKLATDGNIIWEKSYGGSSPEFVHASFVALDEIVVVADSYSDDGDLDLPLTSNELWMIKVDINGAILINTTVSSSNGYALANAIYQKSDGDYLMTGSTEPNDLWVVGLSASIDILWEKAYNKSGLEKGKGITETSDGKIGVVGFSKTEEYENLWVLKLDADGNL